MTTFTDFLNAAVYVGTYGKYIVGNLKGAWLKLNDYKDYEDFRKACNELHSDEEDPELMYQDFNYIDDNFPLSDWWELKEAIEDSDIEDACCAYMSYEGEWTEEACMRAQDCYMGDFDDDEEFARFIAIECGSLNIPEEIECYFDWDAYARDLMFEFTEIDGYYFHD